MNQKIEERAVRKIQEVLDHNYLQQYISVNDKEPSWDGFIYVHNSISERKETILGRIPVQVKGNTTLDLERDKFPISVVDLKNYLYDGGVIYFVVSQHSYPEMEVFYKSLTPNSIKILLEEKYKQITINIKLDKFPTDEVAILELLLSFMDRKNKESSFISSPLYYIDDFTEEDFKKGGSMLFHYRGIESLSIFEKAEAGELGIYYLPGDYRSVPIPIVNKIKNLKISEKVKVDISVCGKVFYNVVIRERSSRNEVRLNFGKSFSFYINTNTNQGKLDFSLTMETDSIEIDYKFFLSLLDHKRFAIFGYEIPFPIDPNTVKNLETVQRMYSYLMNIVKMLRLFNMNDNYELSLLEGHEINNLLAYAESVVNKIPQQVKKENPLNTYIYKNKKFALLFYVTKVHDGWLFHNFFEDAELINNEELIKKLTVLNNISDVMINELGNFNAKYIISLIKRGIIDGFQIDKVQTIILKLLNYYDQNNDIKLDFSLKSLLDLMNWLINFGCYQESKNIGELNKLQIKYRMNSLDTKDNKILMNIITDPKVTASEKFGAAVLLRNKDLSSEYFEKISDEEKINYKNYPIYTLYLAL